jgi:hypothetical protein
MFVIDFFSTNHIAIVIWIVIFISLLFLFQKVNESLNFIWSKISGILSLMIELYSPFLYAICVALIILPLSLIITMFLVDSNTGNSILSNYKTSLDIFYKSISFIFDYFKDIIVTIIKGYLQ